MRTLSRYLAAFGLCGCVAMSAHATVIQLSDTSSLSASDTTLSYPGSDGNSYTGSVSYSAGGNTLTYSGNTFSGYVVGSDFYGSAFANGTPILLASDPLGNPNGPVTLSFTSGISEIGMNIEDPFSFGDYTVTFTAYNGSTALGTYTTSGNDVDTLGFLGLSASGGDLITSLLISDNTGNDLSFGPVTFGNGSGGGTGGPSTVPEPGPLALLGIGLLALASLRNRLS